MKDNPPKFDTFGINVTDPNDSLGVKNAYITLLQDFALRQHLPAAAGLALDVGCGYGRMSHILAGYGWQVQGIDPSEHLITYAKTHYHQVDFVVGSLPDLPAAPASAQLILLQNLLRSLHLIGKTTVVSTIAKYLQPGGYVAVIDNVRAGHPAYLPENAIIELFTQQQLRLEKRVAIRAARWWMIYLIRYGLIPRRWLPVIANWELRRMANKTDLPSRQYYNVLYLFKKV
jgi:SAM-dependent methyltransferase